MSQVHFQSKFPQVGTTIFTVMSALAKEHQAINLGQGFPDFSCDPKLLEAVENAMRNDHNQYPPMTGIPELRQKYIKKLSSFMDLITIQTLKLLSRQGLLKRS